MDESIADSNVSDSTWPFICYTEVLLNYAQAENNLGNEEICRQYINIVRARLSVNMPPVTESEDELLKRLQNEDFIEFAFEGHRYFDVLSWKIAPKVLKIPK